MGGKIFIFQQTKKGRKKKEKKKSNNNQPKPAGVESKNT